MERSGYNSDVSDKQWERLQKYLPELSTRGAHLRKWEPRVIIYCERMISSFFVILREPKDLLDSHEILA